MSAMSYGDSRNNFGIIDAPCSASMRNATQVNAAHTLQGKAAITSKITAVQVCVKSSRHWLNVPECHELYQKSKPVSCSGVVC